MQAFLSLCNGFGFWFGFWPRPSTNFSIESFQRKHEGDGDEKHEKAGARCLLPQSIVQQILLRDEEEVKREPLRMWTAHIKHLHSKGCQANKAIRVYDITQSEPGRNQKKNGFLNT